MAEALAHEKQILEYMRTIDRLKAQNQDQSLFTSEIDKLEQKVELLKKTVYSKLNPWERVQISRHPGRPHTIDYIEKLTDDFQELAGDRLYAEDQSVIGGMATIGGIRCMIIGQEKGNDTESRIKRNFGMVSPQGFRKALRLMKLAEKFSLPVITLLDTPGAYPGLEAEERGQGWAIAANLREMSQLKTPIVVVIIGEGCSGGALGMGVGDVIGMLEHSYYSVISPEGCASILWKDAAKNIQAASALKLNSENLLELNVIDEILAEPMGGAHKDPAATFKTVKKFILEQIGILNQIPIDLLLQQRYLKFRKMGKWVA